MYYYHWIVTMMIFSLYMDLVTWRIKGRFNMEDLFWAVLPQIWLTLAIIFHVEGY